MKVRDLAILIGVIGIVLMLVIPLPTWLLDILLILNITVALLILLVGMNTQDALQFSIFPALLLVTTLFRLALNVSSTRLILSQADAGRVIETFGQFVARGNLAVGFVVFLILVVVNFIVITKGSERVAEVGARFTLDAMPGKQMSIDADLNAGLINEQQAKERRQKIEREADFYGAMDGASKFVRGDAIAGILILFVNIIGGLVIGTTAHDLPISEAARTYTLLTIGDGLVTQIPALLLSTAVAIIVTRVSGKQDMSGELGRQLFGQPRALAVAAGLLGAVGLVPGMPNLAFLAMASLCGAGAYLLKTRRAQAEPAPEPPPPPPPPEAR